MKTGLLARIVGLGFLAALCLGVITLAPATPKAAEDVPPRAIVETYYSALDKVLRNAKTLGFAGRYKALDPAIANSFDIAFMARVAVGYYWRKFEKTQQTSVTNRMHGLSVATYASRFKSYAGEKFEVIESATTARGDVLVRTRIVKSNGEPVKINYLLRKRKNGWRIIDVHLKGTISELARWRSDFSSVLRRKGYDGLIAAIDKKIALMKAE